MVSETIATFDQSSGGTAPMEVTIRPGVTFPDWSAVSSPRVRDTLNAIFEAFGIARCWDSYGAGEDRVRRSILEAYGRDGRAPTLQTLAQETGLAGDEVLGLLASLKKRDLITLDESGGRVTGAYPLTDRNTGHRVRLAGQTINAQTINAMCAIDALGAGGMYGKDADIESACRACGAEIHARTRGHGRALAAVSPEQAVVWSGIEYEDGCAASSLCTVITFFCSDRCLEAWRDSEHPDTKGYRLSIDEAMQAGLAIFSPMLKPAT